jgi:catechol 2,3-dioxygenase-like lactoylglutathione lyase family enzyme
MADRPGTAVRVKDLPGAVAFFVDQIGFTLVESRPEEDWAHVLDTDGDPLLLAGPAVADPKANLAPPAVVFSAGDRVTCWGRDLDGLQARLAARGATDLHVEQNGWGDRVLIAGNAQGDTVAFISPAERTPAETLARFVAAADELEAALSDLAPADLDLARAPDEWTIRQILDHLVGAEDMYFGPVAMAVAQSGQTYLRLLPNPQGLVGHLLPEGQSAAAAVVLIRGMHTYLAQITGADPDCWEHWIVVQRDPQQEGRRWVVGETIANFGGHLVEHVEEIRAIRQAHGR